MDGEHADQSFCLLPARCLSAPLLNESVFSIPSVRLHARIHATRVEVERDRGGGRGERGKKSEGKGGSGDSRSAEEVASVGPLVRIECGAQTDLRRGKTWSDPAPTHTCCRVTTRLDTIHHSPHVAANPTAHTFRGTISPQSGPTMLRAEGSRSSGMFGGVPRPM